MHTRCRSDFLAFRRTSRYDSLRGEELERLTSDAAERIRLRLIEAAGFERLLLRTDPSPWTGAQLADAADSGGRGPTG